MTRPVVFDGAILHAAPWTGVARAFLYTLEAYARDSDTPCVLVVPPGTEAPKIKGVSTLEGARGFFARARRLPRLLAELDAAVLHSPVAALPPRAPCPMVATVHDLPWMAQPALQEDDAGGVRHRLAIRHAARHSAALLCVSEPCRDDLLRYLGRTPLAAVHVVANGVPSPAAPPRQQPNASGPLLVLAADRPRKNLARIREAHALASSQHGTVPPLRVLGPPHEYVTEADKFEALQTATALLHVSLFEGFGLPVVEAFAHGVPVLCSDRGALGWVARDAALHVDPMSVEAIAQGIVRISTDESLRASLHTRGLERAAQFTPERAAHGWRAVHEELAR